MAGEKGLLQGLFVKLGYDYDEEQMKKFDEGVNSTTRLMKKLALTAIGAAIAFAAIFKVLSAGQRDIRRNALQLGIEADELEGILRLSEQVTGQREAALSILNQLAQARRRLIAGEGIDDQLAIGLQQLGISVSQLQKLKPDQLLFAINDSLVELDKTQQEIVLHRLGFSDYTDFLTEVNLRQKTAAQGIKRNRDGFLALEKAVTKVKQGAADIFLNLGKEQVQDIVDLLEFVVKDIFPALLKGALDFSKYVNDITKEFKNQQGFLYDTFKLLELIFGVVKEIIQGMRGLADNEFFNVLGKITTAPFKLVANASETIGGAVAGIQHAITGSELAPLIPTPAAASNISNQSSSKIIQNDVTIFASNGEDARKIKQEFDKATDAETKTIYQQTRSPMSN